MVEDAISFWTDIQRYEDMLAADPRSYCFVPLSELYRKLGLLDDAISVASKGCDLHPDYPGGFFALGAAFNAKGHKPEARKALERVVALKSDHLEALKLLGQLYVEDGQMDLAEQALGAVLRQNPDDTESTLLLHSIASVVSAQHGGELEDVDILEDLEVLEEEKAEEAAAPAGLDEVPQEPLLTEERWGWDEPAKEPETEAFEESSDFWAAGEPEEPSAAGSEPPFEEPEWAFEEAEEAPQEAAFKAAQGTAAPQPQGVIQPQNGTQAGIEPQGEAQRGKDPLSTATLAELYLSQGFTEKALAIYQELCNADPGNEAYRQKVAELKGGGGAPTPQPQEPSAPLDVEGELTRWLENIRRRRDGV